jgi:hypothetical protein
LDARNCQESGAIISSSHEIINSSRVIINSRRDLMIGRAKLSGKRRDHQFVPRNHQFVARDHQFAPRAKTSFRRQNHFSQGVFINGLAGIHTTAPLRRPKDSWVGGISKRSGVFEELFRSNGRFDAGKHFYDKAVYQASGLEM